MSDRVTWNAGGGAAGALAAGMVLWLAGQALAEERHLDVWLEDGAGARLHLAELALDADGQYRMDMSPAPFTNQFLSMRPFRCLEGPDKHWCHLPYPYENRRNISDDLTDLEYDLLFIWKGAGDYGIDTWNGVYYQLEPSGAGYRGTLHEVDMDELAVPPEAGDLRPLMDKHLEPGEPDSHWLPYLVIE